MLDVSPNLMTALHIILIFLSAFLAVFWEASFPGIRTLLGAQVDLLPPLMVYVALNANLPIAALFAVWGGLLFDSLSANPLGVSVLPLFFIGLLIHINRDLILRDQFFAQFGLGFAASAIMPTLTLLLLLTKGIEPLLGWGSLWQWLVVSVGGAVVTPVFFALFGWFNRAFGYQPATETSFRPDREIRRGRN
jgi:rod shape-determining protein MreD